MRNYDAEMAQLLVDIEMLSAGRTQSWNRAGGGEPDWLPITLDSDGDTGSTRGMHERYWDDYVACETDSQREKIIDRARRLLETWRGGAAKGTERSAMSDAALLTHRILKEGRGWSAAEVALALCCSVTMVRKTRILAAVDDEGNPTALTPEPAALADRIRELGERGMTERQIKMLTGAPTSTIRRRLGRAA